jgi:hypothetical protein
VHRAKAICNQDDLYKELQFFWKTFREKAMEIGRLFALSV